MVPFEWKRFEVIILFQSQKLHTYLYVCILRYVHLCHSVNSWCNTVNKRQLLGVWHSRHKATRRNCYHTGDHSPGGALIDQAQSHSTRQGADWGRVHWQPQARQGDEKSPASHQGTRQDLLQGGPSTSPEKILIKSGQHWAQVHGQHNPGDLLKLRSGLMGRGEPARAIQSVCALKAWQIKGCK